ncbi:MAG TPA: biotin/lipoyl-containing protein [Patescibacteria group bacterium]|nr:biotin/lipoyl-containing protein [Patescibacteria group bacterium]
MSARIAALTIPKLGLTMKEGTIGAWHVEPGATVSVGQPVFDVETEKLTSECAADAAGILRRQVADQGATLPVGALVAVIAPPDVSDDEVDQFIAGFQPEQQV